MNKRIKELWVEGTQSIWPNPGKFTAGEYDYNLEKFAELVVATCIEKIKYRVLQFDMDDFEARCVIADIKKEFGIE